MRAADSKQRAQEIAQEARSLLEQAKRHRDELRHLPPGDPRRQDLERDARFLVEKSRELSRIAKGLLAS